MRSTRTRSFSGLEDTDFIVALSFVLIHVELTSRSSLVLFLYASLSGFVSLQWMGQGIMGLGWCSAGMVF